MYLNGQNVHLIYSQTPHSPQRTIDHYAATIPADRGCILKRTSETDGMLVFQETDKVHVIKADWDEIAQKTNITKAWTRLNISADYDDERLVEQAARVLQDIGFSENEKRFFRSICDNALTLMDGTGMEFLSNPKYAPLWPYLEALSRQADGKDKPGKDVEVLPPRPPGSVRTLSMEQHTPAGGLLAAAGYKSSANLTSVDNYYVHAMQAEGWRAFGGPDMLSKDPYSRRSYHFVKESGENCILMIRENQSDDTVRSLAVYFKHN